MNDATKFIHEIRRDQDAEPTRPTSTIAGPATEIAYSRGFGKYDNTPDQRSAADAASFLDAICSDRGVAKGEQWICAPCAIAPLDALHLNRFLKAIDSPHRCSACVQPCNWLAFDIDKGMTPQAFERLQGFLQSKHLQGVVYTTASHTPEKPRCRVILMLDRPLIRSERMQASIAMRSRCDVALRDARCDPVRWDESCDRPEQPLYLPLERAKVVRLAGEPLSADTLLTEHAAYASSEAGSNRRADGRTVAERLAEGDGNHPTMLGIVARMVRAGLSDAAVHAAVQAETWAREMSNAEVQRAIDGARGKLRSGEWAPAPEPGSPHDFEGAASRARFVEMARGDTITPEPISWLWDGWLAAGKLHIIGGAPGTGKTTIALALAATISTGGRWPDGSRAPAGDVVIWSGEDDPADTLVPRLRVAGADMGRIHIVRGIREERERLPFDPAHDIDALGEAMAGLENIRLLLVDPLVSAVAGDSHKNAEVRRGLQPLVDLAMTHRCALLGVTHFSKGTAGRDPLERITGSLAFGALCRIAFVTAKEPPSPSKPGRRLLVRVKSNIGRDDGGFTYELEQAEIEAGLAASAVRWGEKLEGDARTLLGEAEACNDSETERRDAATWLRDLLVPGPMTSKEVKKLASESGFTWRTVQRAMAKAGVIAEREGFPAATVWKFASRATLVDFDPVAPAAPHSESGATGATGELRLNDLL